MTGGQDNMGIVLKSHSITKTENHWIREFLSLPELYSGLKMYV